MQVFKLSLPNSELFIVENGGHLFLLSHVERQHRCDPRISDRDAGEVRKLLEQSAVARMPQAPPFCGKPGISLA